MTRDELKALVAKRLIDNANGPGVSVSTFPVHTGPFDGMGVAGIPRDSGIGSAQPAKNAWIVIVDDRAPDVSGPDSFDQTIMELLLRTASLVAIDSAEPGADIYYYLMDEVASGKRLLVVQTTEERHRIWREFLRVSWRGHQIAEVVPVKNDPTRTLRAFVTHFDRNR